MKKNRAQKAFEDSLIQLLKTKKFSDISVNEIIRLSTYSKASFYSYYDDKYHLAQKLIDDKAEELENLYYELFSQKNESEPAYEKEHFIIVLEHVLKNKDIYHIIINELIPGYNTQRFLRVTNSIYEKYGGWAEEYKGQKTDSEFLAFFLSSTFFSLLLYWDRNNYTKSSEEICEQYYLSLKIILEGNSLVKK